MSQVCASVQGNAQTFQEYRIFCFFVGFPVTSLPKYVQEGTSVFDVDEKCKDLVLADDVIPESP